MPNPIAACTWIFGERDIADIAARLAAVGIDGAEVFVDVEARAADVRRAFDDHRLRVFSLTPANVDIAHPSPQVRAHAVAYYDRLADLAAELGAPMITCHEYVGHPRPDDDREHEWDRLVASCRAIAEGAARRGLEVVYEPLNRSLVSSVWSAERARALVAAVGVPALGIVLDSYHMHREEADPAAAIRACGTALRSFQLSDSERGPIGSGTIDFTAQLRALADIGYQGPLILECTRLRGPSLTNPAVEPELVAADLRISLERLRAAALS